jgi:hypothetical protein
MLTCVVLYVLKQLLGVFMVLKILADKIDFVRKTRSANYRESMRLEGINIKNIKNKATSKESIIAKYKALAS